MTDPQANHTVKSADRVLRVLEVLSTTTSPMTLAEMGRTLNVPKSSLHAILRTMQQRKWVSIGPAPGNLISLGVSALMVGASYDETDRAVARVDPALDWLSAQLDETVHLGRLEGSDVIYLSMRVSAHALRLHTAVGNRFPAHSTALGKAVLSQWSEERLEEFLSKPLEPVTAKTVTDRETLLVELSKARQTGLAVDDGESTQGVRCFAVPLNLSDPVMHGISVEIPTTRLSEELAHEIARLLAAAKKRIEDPRSMDDGPLRLEQRSLETLASMPFQQGPRADDVEILPRRDIVDHTFGHPSQSAR